VKKIRQAELMNKDDVWIKIHALPRKKITDPVLLQLDAAWIEYATVIRDSDDMRGAEIEARIGKLESEVLKRLGATPQQ
jgi:DNA-directed RNA polymerase subunit H (RpoH/RPB5)